MLRPEREQDWRAKQFVLVLPLAQAGQIGIYD